MPGPDFIDQFHRSLAGVVATKIDERMVQMASGSAANFEHYREQVGYMAALNDVLGWAQEVEQNIYGMRKPIGSDNEGE